MRSLGESGWVIGVWRFDNVENKSKALSVRVVRYESEEKKHTRLLTLQLKVKKSK